MGIKRDGKKHNHIEQRSRIMKYSLLFCFCALVCFASGTNDVAIPNADIPNQNLNLAPGDSIFGFAVRPCTTYAVGVTYSRDSFFVSHGQNPIRVYVFDHNGNYVRDFAQIRSAGWGWRDLACSNDTFFGSDDPNITMFGRNGEDYGDFTVTGGPSVCRGLAYDPDSNFFYTADFSSVIYAIRRSNGTVARTYANTYAIYGLAYDNKTAGGPYLWVYHQNPSTLRQFSLRTGQYTTVQWPVGGADVAGGCEVTDQWNPALRTVICLVQGTPRDRIVLIEVAPGTGVKQERVIELKTAITPLAVPNPVRAGKSLTLTIPNTCRSDVRILNAAGSVIRTLKVNNRTSVWDGKLSNGKSAEAGVYFFVVETDKGFESGKLVLVH